MSIKAKQCITVKVPRGGDELELLRSALDAVTESNTKRMMARDDLPCCAECGELDLVEPSLWSHATRMVQIRGAEDTARRRAGPCAELAAFDAGAQNARYMAGKSDTFAACEVIPDARGPGKHHVVVVKSDGTIKDHAQTTTGGCGC